MREGLAYAELVAPIASAWPPAARELLERLVLAGWRQAILAPLRQPAIDWRRFRSLARALPYPAQQALPLTLTLTLTPNPNPNPNPSP